MKPASRLFACLLLALALAACAGGAAFTAAPSPSPGAAAVDSAQAAFAAVRARTPWFDGVQQKDPAAIGTSAWWEASPDVAGSSPSDPGTPPAAWTVSITVGWGDCQADCIDHHTWTWTVTRDGTVTFGTETGSVLSADQVAALAGAAAKAATATGVGGRVTAGPTCPVERPGDPNCAARPVAGAVLVVRGSGGTEVARFTTDASGLYRVPLQPGDYTLVPQPVQGVMGTAPPAPFTVAAGRETAVQVDYDTGIR